MKAPTVKVERQHRPGCRAVGYVAGGTWKTPWCLAEHVYRSIWGTINGHGSHSWLRFRCNTLECGAALLIREEAVLLHFQQQAKGGAR